MEFKGLKCPICNTPFEDDDDIVVCPQCGAPHHRECYEEDGHCYYEEKHKDNFNYNKFIEEQEKTNNKSSETDEPVSAVIKCPVCGEINPGSYLYCRKCNSQLRDNQNYYRQGQGGGANANGPGQRTPRPDEVPFLSVMYDPMAGFDPAEEMDEGVTAGELAKYTQKNSNYFLRVFAGIRDFNKSKFNFSAFLFSGAYMLYRKMYKLGTIFTCIVGLLIVLPILIENLPVFGWQDIFTEASANINSTDYISFSNEFAANLSALSLEKQFVFYLPSVLSIIKWVFMIIAGAIANKSYFKDSVRKVKTIKENNTGDEKELGRKIHTAGGVNTAAAIVALVCYIIVSYIPLIF